MNAENREHLREPADKGVKAFICSLLARAWSLEVTVNPSGIHPSEDLTGSPPRAMEDREAQWEL